MVSQILLLLLGFVSSMVTARWLSVVDRGHLATLNTLGGIGLQLCNLGGPAAILYLAAKDPDRTGSLARAGFTLSLLAGSPTALLLAAWPTAWLGAIPRLWLLVGMAFLPVYLLLWLWRQLLIGRQQAVVASWGDTITRGLVFGWLLLLGFVRHVDVLWIALGGGALAVGQAACWGWRLRQLSPSWPVWPEVWRLARPYALAGFGSGLAAALLLRLDNLMLVAWCSPAELGLYAVAKFALETLGMIPIMLGPMLAAAVVGHADPILATATISRKLSWVSVVALIGLGLAAPWWLPAIFGEPYRPAIPVLQALLPGIWAYLFGNLWLYQLAGDGNPRLVWAAPLTGLAVMVGMGMAVIPARGAVGAAMTASAGFLIQLAVLAIGLRRRYQMPILAAIGLGPYPVPPAMAATTDVAPPRGEG
jgi:O-antigen/teichoic acid export membrane protein